MVAGWLRKEARAMFNGPTFGISRPKIHAPKPGEGNSAGTHGAGLQGHIEIAIDETLAGQTLASRTDHQHFSMGGRIFVLQRAIASTGDDLALIDNDGPNRHFAPSGGGLGLFEGETHWVGSIGHLIDPHHQLGTFVTIEASPTAFIGDLGTNWFPLILKMLYQNNMTDNSNHDGRGPRKPGGKTFSGRSGGPGGDKRAGGRPSGGKPSGDKPFRGKPGGGFGASAGGGKSRDERSSRRPDGDRPFAKRPDGERSFAKRPDGDRPRSTGPREGRGGDDRKSFSPRTGGGERSFEKRGESKYKSPGEGPYQPRIEREYEPRSEGRFSRSDSRDGPRSPTRGFGAAREDRAKKRFNEGTSRSGPRPERAYAPRARPAREATHVPSTMPGERIAKVMARVGLCSRRDAEQWIADGRVQVNGVKLTSPGVNVVPEDNVLVDGQVLSQKERTRLFLFHKPRGLVTTDRDPEGRDTIFSALPIWLPRVVTIGRLDINTEGLLLLTNDGGLARVLELPATGWLRRYRVRANGQTDQAKLDELREGITIDGIEYAGIDAKLDRTQGANVWLTMGLREGKNREIKRVLEHLGLAVNRLIRISFGPFQLNDLPEGSVEEVKTRILQDQLGDTLTQEAGSDFNAPVLYTSDSHDYDDEPVRQPRTRDERRDARHVAPVSRAHRGMSDRPAVEVEEPPRPRVDRPKPGAHKHVSAMRAERERAPAVRRQIERGETEDRNGRSVAVERVKAPRGKPVEDSRNSRRFAEEGSEQKPRASRDGARSSRGDSRPSRDTRDSKPSRDFKPARSEGRTEGGRPMTGRKSTPRDRFADDKAPRRDGPQRASRDERPRSDFGARSKPTGGKPSSRQSPGGSRPPGGRPSGGGGRGPRTSR